MMPAPSRSAISNARLVSEDIVLDAAVERRRAGQDDLEQRRRQRDDFQPLRLDRAANGVHLLVREVDHVAAADDAELGAGHADGSHAVESGVEIVGRELVGDGGGAEGAHSGNGFPLVSGMNGTVANPIRNTRHIVTPA